MSFFQKTCHGAVVNQVRVAARRIVIIAGMSVFIGGSHDEGIRALRIVRQLHRLKRRVLVQDQCARRTARVTLLVVNPHNQAQFMTGLDGRDQSIPMFFRLHVVIEVDVTDQAT